MDTLVASTVVYLPPTDIYDFLTDFPRYADYSEHLTEVWCESGDGGVGTKYALQFEWWKLSYVAESEVTELAPPARIAWRVVKDIDAHGCWRIERLDDLPTDAPDDAETACRVSCEINYDPDSVRAGALNLPTLVSLDWVVDRLQPIAVREAERVVRRVVEDIEGRTRPVEVDIRREPANQQ